MNIFTLAGRLWRLFRTKQPQIDTMLAYFLSTLDVRVRGLTPLVSGDAVKSSILDDVRTRLANFSGPFNTHDHEHEDSAWNEAYRLERLLIWVEPAFNLEAEINRRVADAADENAAVGAKAAIEARDAISAAYAGSNPRSLTSTGEATLRAALLNIAEEVHWMSQRKFYSRPIQRDATYKLVISGLLVFVAFIFPYGWVDYLAYIGKAKIAASWTWLPLYTALTSGLFGALFSRLLFLQQNWDLLTVGGLKDARDFTSIVLRGCVGMTGAVIITFFLQSGIIGGGLFPKYSEVGFEEQFYPLPKNEASTGSQNAMKSGDKPTLPSPSGVQPMRLIYPSESLALLVVWSFLAGFSERLVPTILRDSETSLTQTPATK